MELPGLGNGVVLLPGVHHEQRAGETVHLLHAAQILLQLIHLMEQLDDFLLGKHIEGAVLLHLLQLRQPVHPGAHGLEVGEHTAQPAGVDIEHTDALGFLLHGVLGLLLGAHEQQGLAALREAAHEVIGLLQLADGLLKVDDIDPVALHVDILGHLGVPATGLVAEVNTGLQELFHRYDCHVSYLQKNCSYLWTPPPSRQTGDRPQTGSPRPCVIP